MKKRKFLSVIAVGALLLGAGLTSCQSSEPCEPCEPCEDCTSTETHHYGVSVFCSNGGKVTPSVATAKAGETVEFTIAPEANFTLSSFKVDGTEKLSEVKDNKFTHTMGEASVKVEATFSDVVYKVNIAETTNGTVTASKSEGTSGETITLTVTPNAGFEVETFTVGGADKLSELNNGTFETTIESSDIAVAATFKALSTDSLLTDFLAKAAKATEIEKSGVVNKVQFNNNAAMTTETTYEKYTNKEEGDFSLLTTVSKNSTGKYTNKTVKKSILKDDNLFIVSQNYKTNEAQDGFEEVPSAQPKLETSKGTSIDVNEGSGYLEQEIFSGYSAKFSEAKIKAGTNLKITFEGATTKLSYETVAEDWSGSKTYTLTEGEFTFDGDKLTAVHEKVSTYAAGFTVDEAGNVTLEEGATAKITSKDLTYEFGEAKPETAALSLLKYGSLATKTLTATYFETVNYKEKNEIPNLESMSKGGSYSIKLTAEEGKILDNVTCEVTADWGQDASKINVNYSSWSKEVTINPSGTFKGTLTLKTFNATLSIPLVVIEPAITSLELGITNYNTGTLDKTATLKTGDTLQLSILANPTGCNDKVAFVISGAASEGCKVTSTEVYGGMAHTFTAGNVAGEVVVKAISITDSTIVSNDFVITIK